MRVSLRFSGRYFFLCAKIANFVALSLMRDEREDRLFL